MQLDFCIIEFLAKIFKKKWQIKIYPYMVWPKFKLSTCGLKFNTLPI